MTTPASGPTEEQIRRVIGQARAVVAAAEALPAQAADPADAEWARTRAGYFADDWRNLAATVQAADDEYFTTRVRAVIADFRALEDAPPGMQAAVDPVRAAIDRLAAEFRTVFEPHVDPEQRRLRPAAQAALAAALRHVETA